MCISIKGVAEMLGVSVRHVERLEAAGRLPRAIRLGRAKRYFLHDIERWISGESRKPNQI